MDITPYIRNSSLKITVKPNSSKTVISGYDAEKNIIKVDVAAVPDKDKANKEIVKFFSKLLKQKVRIKSGLRSREKILEIV